MPTLGLSLSSVYAHNSILCPRPVLRAGRLSACACTYGCVFFVHLVRSLARSLSLSLFLLQKEKKTATTMIYTNNVGASAAPLCFIELDIM